MDGIRDTPVSYTCERRSEYIIDGAECIQAFLHCCKEIESQRAEKKVENLQLARSKKWGQGIENNEVLTFNKALARTTLRTRVFFTAMYQKYKRI